MKIIPASKMILMAAAHERLRNQSNHNSSSAGEEHTNSIVTSKNKYSTNDYNSCVKFFWLYDTRFDLYVEGHFKLKFVF